MSTNQKNTASKGSERVARQDRTPVKEDTDVRQNQPQTPVNQNTGREMSDTLLAHESGMLTPMYAVPPSETLTPTFVSLPPEYSVPKKLKMGENPGTPFSQMVAITVATSKHQHNADELPTDENNQPLTVKRQKARADLKEYYRGPSLKEQKELEISYTELQKKRQQQLAVDEEELNRKRDELTGTQPKQERGFFGKIQDALTPKILKAESIASGVIGGDVKSTVNKITHGIDTTEATTYRIEEIVSNLQSTSANLEAEMKDMKKFLLNLTRPKTPEVIIQPPESQKYGCPICNEVFDSLDNMFRHVSKQGEGHDEIVECFVCDKPVYAKCWYYHHSYAHGGVCNVCGNRVEGDYIFHLETEHAKEETECPECGMEGTFSAMRQHLHEDHLIWTMDIKDKKGKRKGKTIRMSPAPLKPPGIIYNAKVVPPVLVSIPPEVHRCSLCSLLFHSDVTLCEHVKVHHKEKLGSLISAFAGDIAGKIKITPSTVSKVVADKYLDAVAKIKELPEDFVRPLNRLVGMEQGPLIEDILRRDLVPKYGALQITNLVLSSVIFAATAVFTPVVLAKNPNAYSDPKLHMDFARVLLGPMISGYGEWSQLFKNMKSIVEVASIYHKAFSGHYEAKEDYVNSAELSRLVDGLKVDLQEVDFATLFLFAETGMHSSLKKDEWQPFDFTGQNVQEVEMLDPCFGVSELLGKRDRVLIGVNNMIDWLETAKANNFFKVFNEKVFFLTYCRKWTIGAKIDKLHAQGLLDGLKHLRKCVERSGLDDDEYKRDFGASEYDTVGEAFISRITLLFKESVVHLKRNRTKSVHSQETTIARFCVVEFLLAHNALFPSKTRSSKQNKLLGILTGLMKSLDYPEDIGEEMEAVYTRYFNVEDTITAQFKAFGVKALPLVIKTHPTEAICAVGAVISIITSVVSVIVAAKRSKNNILPKKVKVKRGKFESEKEYYEAKYPDVSVEKAIWMPGSLEAGTRSKWSGYVISDPDATIYQTDNTWKLDKTKAVPRHSDGKAYLEPGKYLIERKGSVVRKNVVPSYEALEKKWNDIPFLPKVTHVNNTPVIYQPGVDQEEEFQKDLLKVPEKFTQLKQKMQKNRYNRAKQFQDGVRLQGTPTITAPRIKSKIEQFLETKGILEDEALQILLESNNADTLNVKPKPIVNPRVISEETKIAVIEQPHYKPVIKSTVGEFQSADIPLWDSDGTPANAVDIATLSAERTEDLVLSIDGKYVASLESATRQVTFDIHHRAVAELLDRDGKHLSHGVLTDFGIAVNKHAVDRVGFVKVDNAPAYKLPKPREEDRADYNGDLVVLLYNVPGIPKDGYIKPSMMADLKEGVDRPVCLVTKTGKHGTRVHPGYWKGNQHNIDFGKVGAYDSNTSRGDCGGVVFTPTGKVVGMHFFGGIGSNLFVPLDKEFAKWLSALPKNSHSLQSIGGECP